MSVPFYNYIFLTFSCRSWINVIGIISGTVPLTGFPELSLFWKIWLNAVKISSFHNLAGGTQCCWTIANDYTMNCMKDYYESTNTPPKLWNRSSNWLYRYVFWNWSYQIKSVCQGVSGICSILSQKHHNRIFIRGRHLWNRTNVAERSRLGIGAEVFRSFHWQNMRFFNDWIESECLEVARAGNAELGQHLSHKHLGSERSPLPG